jgi:hypothetical protein
MSVFEFEFNGKKYCKLVGKSFTNKLGQEERNLFYTIVPSETTVNELLEAANTVSDLPSIQYGTTANLNTDQISLLEDALN